jgi:diguanylate cyclase (GGDEF)-like protein/PAS domain S-box-containing protein
MRGETVDSPYVVKMVRKDGQIRNWQMHTSTIEWDGKTSGLGIFMDITEQLKAETDLRIAAVAFQSQEAMMNTDANGVILRVNQQFTNTSGYRAEEIVGKYPNILKSGRHDANFYRAMWASLLNVGSWQGEIWDRRKNGDIYPKWLSITAVKNKEGTITHYVGSHADITERKALDEAIREMAFYDQLTQLPNRRLLDDRLRTAISACKRGGHYGALMFLDLDNFKPLNDNYGHDVGDLLLIEVAHRLTSCVREVDTVSRFGGDEFVVVISELDEGNSDYIAQAQNVAEKIRTKLINPYTLLHRTEGNPEEVIEHRCSASIGLVFFSGEDRAEHILKCADKAMYKAKVAGRNQIHIYQGAT